MWENMTDQDELHDRRSANALVNHLCNLMTIIGYVIKYGFNIMGYKHGAKQLS